MWRRGKIQNVEALEVFENSSILIFEKSLKIFILVICYEQVHIHIMR